MEQIVKEHRERQWAELFAVNTLTNYSITVSLFRPAFLLYDFSLALGIEGNEYRNELC